VRVDSFTISATIPFGRFASEYFNLCLAMHTLFYSPTKAECFYYLFSSLAENYISNRLRYYCKLPKVTSSESNLQKLWLLVNPESSDRP